MSAFIVSRKVINHVVWAMTQEGRFFDTGSEATPAVRTALGRELYGINARAVSQRYSEKEKYLTYAWVDETPDPVVAFKACECFLYQCSEGDVPDSDLFKRVEAACNALARDIVTKLPAYDAAPWGG